LSIERNHTRLLETCKHYYFILVSFLRHIEILKNVKKLSVLYCIVLLIKNEFCDVPLLQAASAASNSQSWQNYQKFQFKLKLLRHIEFLRKTKNYLCLVCIVIPIKNEFCVVPPLQVQHRILNPRKITRNFNSN
jgi:hypothetical protein